MKRRYFHIAILAAILCVSSLAVPTDVSAQYSYTPLEKIPGTDTNSGKMADYIQAIYKFALWSVGIAAMFMLAIGGMMYLTSAGNTSQTGSAKKVIEDAVVGLVLAFVAWLILYVINPDLVKVNLNFSAAGSAVSSNTSTGTTTNPTVGCGKVVDAAHTMVGNCTYNQQLRNGCAGSPAYTDCSDFTAAAYKKAGCTSPPNTTATMMTVGEIYNNNQSGLKAGDALVYQYQSGGETKGHVVVCENDGCSTITAASGTASGLVQGQPSASYLSKSGLKVLRAATYCGNAAC
ncbi:MAG: pilin [Candidatus Moraniibacteriota bacterium]